MPLPLLPIAGAAAVAGGRFVAGQVGKRMTQSAIKQQALKQGAMAASGLGVLSASPAQAPGSQSKPDTATVSREASRPPAAESPMPNFASSFGP